MAQAMSLISEEQARTLLATVIDPELNIDIVSLGLIYDVSISQVSLEEGGSEQRVHVLMTLTTPGCPLAPVIEEMVRSALAGHVAIDDKFRQVSLEITFDPPWIPEMMTEEARAELGL